MIVPKHVIPGILAGTVTSIRVPLDIFKLETWTDQDGLEQTSKPRGLVALRSAHDRPEGHPPSKPAPAGKPICTLRILSADRVTLDETTSDEARSDGYSDADEYSLAYMATYADSWTSTEGWLLTFEINKREPAHLLRVAWDPGSDGSVGPEREPGPEPEGVKPHLIHPGWSLKAEQARVKAMMERESSFRNLPLAEQLRRAIEDAKAQGVDTSSPEYVIGKQVERLRKMSRKAA